MLRNLMFFLFVTAWTVAKADYGNMPLSAIMCHADYGALGTIVKVDNNYFYLKVEKYVLNNLELDTIPIIRFYNWSCARRYDGYSVGQRELVFFNKSNYVINTYDLMGFGMGDEFELPISNDSVGYQVGYGKLEKFGLNDFLSTLNDFAKLKGDTRLTEKDVTTSKWEVFAKRSLLHRRFVGNCVDEDAYYYIPSKETTVSLETKYLYENYENRLFINNSKNDSIYIQINDGDVRKKSNYYVVDLHRGASKRKLSVYAVKGGNRKLLFEKSFEVKELPTPGIFFQGSIDDTILFSNGRSAVPDVAYIYDGMKEDYPKYKLLSYTYEIVSGGNHEIYVAKSAYGTHDLWERLKHLQNNDKIILSNVLILYPNKEVKRMPNKTAVVKMMKKTG